MRRFRWLALALYLVCVSARSQHESAKVEPAKPAADKTDASEIPVPASSFAVSAVTVGRYTPVYVGVDQAQVTVPGKHASVAYAMRVDLKAPGIRFMSTPHAGQKETISDTSKDFAREQHLQVAINAGFFAPCCSEKPEEKDVQGLAIAEGKMVSPRNTGETYRDALMITEDNVATIAPVTESTDLSRVYTAVTGSAVIVTHGRNTGGVNTLNKASYGNPRTVVGLSRDGRYLYLVAIDGRKPGYSFGTTNTESATIMIALGAYTAINLDGGGSTSMVREDAAGKVVTVNKPSGGTDRMVADSFGLHARTLPHPAAGH
jgi:exopolysaccharide biosynthesis protein